MHSTKVNNLLTAIDRLYICLGHPDNHFVDMLKNKNDVMKSIGVDDFCDLTFNYQSYNVTVRHTDCEISVVDTGKCPTCTAYRSTLRTLYCRDITINCNLITALLEVTPTSATSGRQKDKSDSKAWMGCDLQVVNT